MNPTDYMYIKRKYFYSERNFANEAHLFYVKINYILAKYKQILQMNSTYRISVNSFRGNYSFLNLALCTVTFGDST